VSVKRREKRISRPKISKEHKQRFTPIIACTQARHPRNLTHIHCPNIISTDTFDTCTDQQFCCSIVALPPLVHSPMFISSKAMLGS
jgi:hypothetical protein